jgi:hypothetical protein
MEQFLSSLYNYKLIRNDERKEMIEINGRFKVDEIFDKFSLFKRRI